MVASKLTEYVVFGLFALLGVVVIATFFPGFFMALLFLVVLAGLAVFAPRFAATTPGIAIILVLLLLAALFGFAQFGHQASLAIVNGLP